MTDLTLLETEDAIRRVDLRDAMEAQSRIERIFNPPRMARVPIFRDGIVDGVGLAAVRYQSRYIAPPSWWARAIVRAWGWVMLRRAE